jgi:hypothetical protein
LHAAVPTAVLFVQSLDLYSKQAIGQCSIARIDR